MKTWLALLACCAALMLAVPALGEPGDEPNCPWEYMPASQVARLEEVREEQIVGGVKGSPYWLWQAYLGSGSLDLRLYDVSRPVFPTQMLFKERIRYDGAPDKTMTLTIRGDIQQVELRIDSLSLFKLAQANVEKIVVVNGEGETVQAYAREDIEAIFAYFELGEEDTLCLQGEDAPLYMMTADGFRKAVTAK